MAQIAAELGLNLGLAILFLVPMVKEWLAPTGDYNAVDLGFGLSDPAHWEDFGGGNSAVALFDANGARIGMQKHHGSTKQGNTAHLKVYALDKHNNISPEYITVSQSGDNDDAVCLSYVSVTAQSGDKSVYSMAVGEYAYACNANTSTDYPWAYSNRGVQIKHGDKMDTIRPRCLWLDTPDAHGIRGTKYAGFSAHLVDFNLDASAWKQWQEDPHQMCGSEARFHMYETLNERQCPQVFKHAPKPAAHIPMDEVPGCHPDVKHPDPHTDPAISKDDEYALFKAEDVPDLVWAPPKQHVGHWKRDEARERRRIKKRAFAERFVSSPHPEHSAKQLCGDPASAGPDFYSEDEHLFCAVSTHTLYEICSGTTKTNCFDLEAKKIRPEGHLVTRDEWPEYSDIQYWT